MGKRGSWIPAVVFSIAITAPGQGSAIGFSIFDETTGSDPFIIQSGAPTDSLVIAGNGNIGLGTSTPAAPLHVVGDPSREVVRIESTGTAWSVYLNSLLGESWRVGVGSDGRFQFSRDGSGVAEFVIRKSGTVTMGKFFEINPAGNMSITGKLKEGSSRTLKENIQEVDGDEVLAILEKLPISRWTYKSDAAGTQHMGPMAEDFYSAFMLGEDNRHIAPMDAAAIALVAIKEQQQAIRDKDGQIAALQERLSALEELVARELNPSPANLGSSR